MSDTEVCVKLDDGERRRKEGRKVDKMLPDLFPNPTCSLDFLMASLSISVSICCDCD